MPERFDAAYFDRLYRVAGTAVYTQAQIDRLATGITSLIDWWGFPLRSVLDVGAGTAMWRDYLARERPDVEYTGVDTSAHACATYGLRQADIATWCDDRAYDLIVCHGVAGYLDDDACARAIDHLAAMADGFLFFHVATEEDLQRGAITERSDNTARRRPAAFYRALLRPYFLEVGAALWLAHDAAGTLLALEHA